MVQSQEIRQAMQTLTMKGSFGKLFDNNVDFAGKGNWRVFEMETLMGIPSIVPPTLDYLFHQIETAIRNATGPSLIVLDECWLFLDNEVFQNKLKEYFKDMRKKTHPSGLRRSSSRILPASRICWIPSMTSARTRFSCRTSMLKAKPMPSSTSSLAATSARSRLSAP